MFFPVFSVLKLRNTIFMIRVKEVGNIHGELVVISGDVIINNKKHPSFPGRKCKNQWPGQCKNQKWPVGWQADINNRKHAHNYSNILQHNYPIFYVISDLPSIKFTSMSTSKRQCDGKISTCVDHLISPIKFLLQT